MEIQELLEQVKAGTLSIEEAKQYLRKAVSYTHLTLPTKLEE